MNKKGTLLMYGMMVAVVLIIFALAIAPVLTDITAEAMNSSTIKYTYYQNIRDWSSYHTNLTNGEYIMNDSQISLYESFTLYNTLSAGTFFYIENITLKLKRVGNPTGNVTIKITEGNTPFSDNVINFTNNSLEISSIDTSFENVTFDMPYPKTYMSVYPYYMLSITVDGVDDSKYLVVGTTNITSLFTPVAFKYNNSGGESNIQLDDEVDLLFKFSVRDGGTETFGLDCDNASISNFDKAACIAIDLTPFYVVGFIILIAGAVITARFI